MASAAPCAYVASHDLQEPLRKVASFCQMIERRYGDKLDERGRQYIDFDFAVDGAKRMQLLINDLLSFSRVGRFSRTDPSVGTRAALDRALDNLSHSCEDTSAEVSSSVAPIRPGCGSARRPRATVRKGRSLESWWTLAASPYLRPRGEPPGPASIMIAGEDRPAVGPCAGPAMRRGPVGGRSEISAGRRPPQASAGVGRASRSDAFSRPCCWESREKYTEAGGG